MAENENQKEIGLEEEQNIVRSIVRSCIYICMHYKEAKKIFDLVNMGSLCSGRVCIGDISESPIGFVIEAVGTKSYIYYNSKLLKVKYVAENHEILRAIAEDVDSMQFRLDERLKEVMKDMTEEIKELIMKKIDADIAMMNRGF